MEEVGTLVTQLIRLLWGPWTKGRSSWMMLNLKHADRPQAVTMGGSTSICAVSRYIDLACLYVRRSTGQSISILLVPSSVCFLDRSDIPSPAISLALQANPDCAFLLSSLHQHYTECCPYYRSLCWAFAPLQRQSDVKPLLAPFPWPLLASRMA
jgi:hypothetical protein